MTIDCLANIYLQVKMVLRKYKFARHRSPLSLSLSPQTLSLTTTCADITIAEKQQASKFEPLLHETISTQDQVHDLKIIGGL